MTALVYWRGRLQAGEPIHHQAATAKGADVRFLANQGPNGWPNALNKQSLYADYLWWFETVYLQAFREAPYYRDNPGRMPKPMDRLPFFSVMGPIVNPLGTADRTYPVKVNIIHEGRSLKIKRSRSFYRLPPLDVARKTFVETTGMTLDVQDNPTLVVNSLSQTIDAT